MQVSNIPIFRPWVPEWLARAIIFGILLTSLLGFGLYSSNAESAIGYYGIEPADVQYSVVLMYAAGVSFLALDFRIVKYISPRTYILAGFALNFITYLICFYTKHIGLFMVCRYIQGIACALLCSVVLHLIFPRLHATRSRAIGYTVFYGGLQTSIPISAICCSTMLHYFDFEWLFYGLSILIVPVLVAVLLAMHPKARFYKKIPLYQVDWVGYLYYAVFCCIFGYVLVYGQQLNWVDSPRILFLIVSCVVLLLLFVFRETRLKRPLINLTLFKFRDFVIGLFLLIAFYVFKGANGFAYGYIHGILGVDPLHMIPIWVVYIIAVTLAMFVTARFVLSGVALAKLIICGFVVLALYYAYMLTFISVTGETYQFMLPLFIHGIACGVLFVPLVFFTAATIPPKLAYNVSMLGIFFRFVGFCLSISINNYTQLSTRAAVREQVRAAVYDTNPQLTAAMKDIQDSYRIFGNDYHNSNIAASGFLDQLLKKQIVARSIRDYHDLMLCGLLLLILLLLVIPGIRKIVLRLSSGAIPY